jgi:hypothetical protein
VVGAVGEAHPVAGGLLCSGTLVALGAGRAVRAVSLGALATATGLQLVGAAVAARHVGVADTWGRSVAAVAVVVGLAGLAAVVLRRDQPGAPS